MSFKVQYGLPIFILIIILNVKCSEAIKLFNLTEDAISVGREILKEVEKINSPNVNVTDVSEEVHGLLRKFHNRNNSPLRFNYITNPDEEIESETLKQQLRRLDKYTDTAPRYLKFLMNDYNSWPNQTILFPSREYVEENVFDLKFDNSMQTKLNDDFNALFKKDPDTGDNIINILTKQSSKWVCWSGSRQQLLYNLLNYLITEEAFQYVLTQYFYASYEYYYNVLSKNKDDTYNEYRLTELKIMSSTWKEKNVIKRMKNVENDFIARNGIILKQFVEAMTGQSREAWSCDKNSNENHGNREYTMLDNLFQMYVVNEVDLNKEGTCKKECADYRETKLYGCYDGGICKRQRTCNGTLRDCGKQIDSPMQIGLKDESTTIRYNCIESNGEIYGHKERSESTIEVKSWPRGFYKCTYCTCTCEEMNNNGDRYFNLRPVQSDIKSNYVITNVKFVKENNIVHVQIEEGQLLNNGYINQSSLRWKKVDNYTIYDEDVKEYDFHTITWNKRKVYLGDLESPRNHVLTALRISSVIDGIKLDIGYTPYDFTTGKLSDSIDWITNSQLDHKWSELKLNNKDEIITDSYAKFVKFTTSNVKIDAGQTTIPYLVTDQVIFRKLMVPLSGAGLFTQSQTDVGSFLALKLLTYNFVDDM